MQSLKIARYEIHACAKNEAAMPAFFGTALRGAFGHALKTVTCSVEHGECSRCILVERCLYPRLFETTAQNENCSATKPASALTTSQSPNLTKPQALLKRNQDAPRPFIFMPPLPARDSGFMRARDDYLRWRVRIGLGNSVVFGLILFGPALDELPFVIHALRRMMHSGLGAERVQFELEKVFALDAQGKRKEIYARGATLVQRHQDCHVMLARIVEVRQAQLAIVDLDKLTLRFLTPTRLRLKGELVEDPSFAQLIGSISLRLSLLAETFGQASLICDHKSKIERAREVSTLQSSLCLMALDRYSNRHKAKMALDGFTGDITFRGPFTVDLLELLIVGELLHIGSGTAFGLGRYVILN